MTLRKANMQKLQDKLNSLLVAGTIQAALEKAGLGSVL
jgi:hypothetical protein